jgi:uroporphyrinogen-III decarboxylase
VTVADLDFAAHNERSRAIWEAYRAGRPVRVPVTIYADARNWMRERDENVRGITLPDYLRSMDLMFECQVLAEEWIRTHVISDDGMGPPPGGWSVRVDFQNWFEMAWFGAEIRWGEEPHTRPFLSDDAKRALFDRGPPDPAGGVSADAYRHREYFLEKARTYRHRGLPVTSVSLPFNMTGTDGPFTVACGIRGADRFCTDLLDDPGYAEELLTFIVAATIERIREARRRLGEPAVSDGWMMADDAIVLLSPSQYRDHVLPHHRRLFEALSTGSRGVHLCGDAQRFFPIIERELGVKSFDTGFPIDFARLYEELSGDVQVLGGPPVALLRGGTPEEVRRETARILGSGVMRLSRRFVLREANALAPGTPLENVSAMYAACEEHGRYRRDT